MDAKISVIIQQAISDVDNEVLCRIPSAEEIKGTIDQIGSLKAPGSDGMSAIFYHHYWETVQDRLTEMVIHFFRTSFMVKPLNHSFIVLLPKVEHPSCIEQYRPISLCKVAYKVISKVLSNRLKVVISKLISPYQAAFVPGRVIQENIILGQELLHSMKAKRGRKGLAALKLDMAKAYDRMEWGFLIQVMRCFGFRARWIGWVEQCILTVSFSVLLNGFPFGRFSPSQGLRQGDPLSPFLFILGSEVLSRLLLLEEERGFIHCVKVNRAAPSILHLLFADDIMIFVRANR